jgi:hypothetical protein
MFLGAAHRWLSVSEQDKRRHFFGRGSTPPDTSSLRSDLHELAKTPEELEVERQLQL